MNEILEYLAVELLGWERRQWGLAGKFVCWARPAKVSVQSDYLLTGNGMLEIIEAMRERWWFARTHRNGVAGELTGSSCMFATEREVKMTDWHNATTLPEAVARAAYAALKEQDNDQ